MTIKLKTTAPALLAAATLFLTACGSDTKPLQATPPGTTAPAAPTSVGSSPAEASMTESTESSTTESSTTESATEESSTQDSSTQDSSTQESSTQESSTASSSKTSGGTSTPASASGQKVIIKAGAAKAFPAKVGQWIAAPPNGPGTIYNQGDMSVIVGISTDAELATISTAVTDEKTPVPAGLCGRTSTEGNYLCYLGAEDGVINLSGDDLDTVVAFAKELTSTLGTS